MKILVSLSKILTKKIYWPLCRVYARFIVKDNQADKIFRILCSLQFRWVHKFWPNFSNPQSFSEKLFSRMLFKRDKYLTRLNDKLQVREFVITKGLDKYLIPLLWKGINPEDIRLDELPPKFVIKTNHGCGYNIIVRNKELINLEEAKKKLRKWLKENFCLDKYIGTEWGYKNILPAIFIEEFIEVDGKPPVDYKFYCFHGKVEVLTIHYDRFEDHKTRAFNRNFEPDEFRYDFEQWHGECKRPKNFDEMVQIAESLAEEFDFMRIDLYNVDDRIYFSEITPYPGGVSTKFLPKNRDYDLGAKW